MNKKIALILACCAATSFAACNETTEWNFTESCGTETKRCVESTIQVCKDGVWVPEVTCEGATPWCDVTTHTCIAKPVAKDCQDGAQKCDQDAVWTCNNGKWEKTTDCAADGKVCNNTTHVCDPKAQPEVTCDHNGTKLTVGATACDGDTTLVTCTASEDGTTGELKSAPCAAETPICDANACRAYNKCAANGADVEHNATVCDGTVSKKCNDGTLEIVEDCSTKDPAQVCLAETGVCGDAPATACTDTTVGTVNDGEKVCKDNNLWTCDNTQLSQTMACTVTPDDTSKSFVATCIAANGDTAAHCDKKCAEDTALNEVGDACEPIDGKDDICRINNNVAQVKHFKFGQFSEWNNCSDNQEAGTENAAEYGCNDAGDGCIVKSCVAGYHPVKGDNGKYTCEHDITMNCGTGADGKPFEINSYHCNDDNTKVMVCSAENSTDYTASLQQAAVCDASKGFTCDPKKVGTLEACACTDTMPAKCVENANFAEVTSCDSATGKIITTDCTKNIFTKSAKCNEEANACGKPICNDGYVVANGVCGKCNVEGAESCGAGKICNDKGKCVDGEEPACTTDSCSEGMIKKCVDKKYADAVSCIANGVGTCKSATECDTINFTCNVNYMKVDKECKKYDTVECTTGVCTDSYYFGCPAAATGEAKRYHSAPVGKPADDANGTWACDVAKGWDLTCTETELYEVKDGKCALKPGKCKTDTDCTDATKTKCNTTTKTCEASATPAPECTDAAIQCVSDAKYKTCTGGTWGEETDVATGLKCDTTAHKLVCKDDAAKTCNGTKVMGCEDGKLNQVIEDCATNTDGKTTCFAGECVKGGAPAPTKSLIISEVAKIENSNSKKHSLHFYEIYNATDSVANMDGCSINIYKSKKTIIDKSIPLDGSLNASSTYVVCYGGFDDSDAITQSLNTKCNSRTVDVSTQFSTKRVVELKCNEKTIDIIGKPGDENSVTQNNMIRNCSITKGISDEKLGFQASEWTTGTSSKEGLSASLGTHKAVCDTPVE